MKLLNRISDYMFETENPIIQIMYFIIGPVCYLIYSIYIFGFKVEVIGYPIVLTGHLIAWIAFYFYYRAWKSSPGVITQRKVESYVSKYAHLYDGICFKPDAICKTCNLTK